jgi:hyperosmotically inducible periplasmic protein
MRSDVLRKLSGAGVSSVLAFAGVILEPAVPAAQQIGVQETTLSIRRALERLPYYGVFDFMAVGVDRGVVTLRGYAYHGGLRTAAEVAVRRTSGVDEVANRLEVLPASQEDDRIRWVTFYRIYTDAFLSRYAPGGATTALREIRESRRFPGLQPLGTYPIHIIVKNGRTTLLGVVDNEGDRQIAEVRAREVGGVFAVENELVIAEK